MELKGCRVLVTGGARRVGRCIVERLAFSGAAVAIHANRSFQAAQELAVLLGDKGCITPLTLSGDVTRRQDWEALRNRIEAQWGALDVLIHNAAVFEPGDVAQTTESQWDRMMAVNARSVLTGTQELIPLLKRGNSPRVIAIGDVAGKLVWPGYLAYSVSKSAQLALVRGLAKSLAPDILVNAVSPGPVLLPDGSDGDEQNQIQATIPLNRFGVPRDVADAVCFLITGGDYITGMDLRVDGGRTVR